MFGPRRHAEDFSEEVRAHIALEAEGLRAEGLSEADALAAARRRFGNVLGAEERFYESSRWMWLDHLRQDLRYAARQLRKSPDFTAVAILTLALGIGANTAIFSLIDAVMLRPLSVKDPGQLYRLGDNMECCVIGGWQNDVSIFPYVLYKQLRDGTPEFETMAAVQANESTLSVRRSGVNTPAEPVEGEFVSGNFFEMFGITPAAGRLMSAADDRPAAPPVVVISYRLWRERYGMDPSLIGSTLLLNGAVFTVAGIASPGFFGARYMPDPPDLWMTLNAEPLIRGKNGHLRHDDESWLYILGRLKAGVSPASVEAKVNGEMRRWIAAMLGSHITAEDRKHIAQQYIRLTSAAGGIGGLRANYRYGLQLLMAASGLLLLIACANIANLSLARGAANQVQNSIRSAIGASRARLFRQALTESVLLAVIGGIAGLAVAFAATRMILRLAFQGAKYIPFDATPSLPALGFTFLVSLVTGVAFGAIPGWIRSRTDPALALHGAGRSTDRSGLPRRLLVAFQSALALALLASAGLLTRSLLALEKQQFGFETTERVMIRVNPLLTGYTPERMAQTYRQLRERLAGLPGVRDASLSLYSPMEFTNWEGAIRVEGQTWSPESAQTASWDRVSPRYFETIGTPLLLGRGIAEQDIPASRRVAVVNETFVRKFFPHSDPVGKHFGWMGAPPANDYEIVGVAKDAKYIDADQPAHQMFFLPLLQMSKEEWQENGTARSNYISDIELRLSGPVADIAGQVKRALAEISPDITVLNTQTFSDQLGLNFNRERLLSRLTLLFGMVALVLACVGLYGVTAYMVVQRTPEIGIRMAFGASRADVIAMVIRNAALQMAVGAVAGVALALACGRMLESRLYQVKANDPAAVAGATLLLACCALAAAYLPARRASTIDPMQALRRE